ncbi:hypothetical protein MRB53_035520 [Persea americana]|uniref:Uncharacterized protein n=1 Tax=Persea americana TaxID=3435 RepID=A0ACC2K4U6_PERAE|nr:hypothetical protein MRB53_035520 [Persea americana]
MLTYSPPIYYPHLRLTLQYLGRRGKPALSVPLQMLANSKESFTYAAIGRFLGRRPLLEWVEAPSRDWNLSRSCTVSLTAKGNFIFRLNSEADRDHILSLSPITMAKRKLQLLPWHPGQEETNWPTIVPLWIRLSIIIPSLISHNQSTFVKGRSIHRHSALAHELFEKLNTKIKHSAICLQLYITEAFDRLQRSFLFKAIEFFKFSKEWISLIKKLITTSGGSVLINRGPCGFFPSYCGLRQGDPLFPYLFILAKEILNLNAQKLQSNQIIHPVSPVPKTPFLLLEADDIVLFLRAFSRSISGLMVLFAKYEAAAGQKFNLSKRYLFIGKSTKSPQPSFPPTDTVSLLIDDGRWVIPPHLPLQIRQHLQLVSTINIPSPQVANSIKWIGNASGNLSLKDA